MTPSQRRAINAYRASDRIVTVERTNPNRTINFTVRNDNGNRVLYYQVGVRGGITNMGYSLLAENDIKIDKGNVLVNKRYDGHALVLALTKDGTRAKLHIFGRDEAVWHPLDWYAVQEAGSATCWKCSGSGLYYFGGATVNGVFTGQTGICFACEGKGGQTNEARRRCPFSSTRDNRADLLPDEFPAESDGN